MRKGTDACYGCERRCVGCHSSCADYLAYRKALTDRNFKINNARSLEKMFRDYRVKTIQRVQHRKDIDTKGK